MARTPLDRPAVRAQLLRLQDDICADLEAADGEARFRREEHAHAGGGLQRPRVLEEGPVLEKAAVHFSHTLGSRLPEAATERHPDLAGLPYEALSVSLIVHPRNPHAPTSHANFRFFVIGDVDAPARWWFGGGFDLTPYYGYVEDVVHWHRTAHAACDEVVPGLYPRLKRNCDEYFRLPHRGEPRGVGGVFYDDYDEGDFDACFRLHRGLGEAYRMAYLPILTRRKNAPYTPQQRAWQEQRRGRYVEFNLLYDRGTRFGLLAGARVSSLLASLPPVVRWPVEVEPRPGTEEHRLLHEFLPPRDWIDAEGNPVGATP